MTLARFLSLASPESPASPGADDYFSSDLSDETFRGTFGKLAGCGHVVPSKKRGTEGGVTSTRTESSSQKSMLVLISGSDEHVNKRIDKDQLMSRWKNAIRDGCSGQAQSSSSSSSLSSPSAILSPHSLVVKNALHDISGSSVETRTARLIDMRRAVLSYLNDVVGDLDDGDNDGDGAKSGPWKIWRDDKNAIEAERAVQGIKL